MIRADGLYAPEVGDLLVRDTGENVLVGHVNENGGCCDDCFDAPWEKKFAHHDEKGTFWYRLDPGWWLERNVLA